jgi:hypothetical protein
MSNAQHDAQVIDAIALTLGTSDDWNGADFLDAVAEFVGEVRPRPGRGDSATYARRLFEASDARKPFHGFPVVAQIPLVGDRGEWAVIVKRGESDYIGFWADDMTAVNWSHGHYFGHGIVQLTDDQTELQNAMDWALDYAGWKPRPVE